MGLLSETALAERVLDHVARGTTDLAAETWREPVANYRSEARFRQEVEEVLRRVPAVFCPSAALPDPGSYVARDAAGVPLVAVRGRDGTVRVFRNSCRHRGTAVACGAGDAASLVCPYHGWVYRLDGSLRHVPDEYGFPGLDPADRGLVAVDAVEQGGLVFARQDGAAGQPLAAGVPVLLGDDSVLLGQGSVRIDANWKVLVEGFLEGYHLKATHRDTFFPFGYDNVTVVEAFGPHSRITFPFRRVEALRDVPPGERSLDGLVTLVYHLFPNVIVARLSHHTTIAVLEPLTPAVTELVTYQLGNRRSVASDDGGASRDAAFVALGALEDQDMARAVQRGLASGANETVEFGRFEGALTHFHRQLHALVDPPR